MASKCDNIDWQLGRKAIRERGEYLLQNSIWSDCRFIVGTESNQQIFHGHKLILAMSSPVFEAMFYGVFSDSDKPIPIMDLQPEAFKALLEYIYTDRVSLSSFDQACELCYVAKKYMFPHLVEICTKYIWYDLYPKNACRAYQFAKLFEEPILMDKCLQIIQQQTRAVLFECNFEDVEPHTVLTICEQDTLSIPEIQLFNAVEHYSNINVSKHTFNAECLDDSDKTDIKIHPIIRDALKQIRFLSLSPEEFANGPANSSLLTQSEKYALIINICSEDATTPMPEGFCTIRKMRNYDSSSFVSNEEMEAQYDGCRVEVHRPRRTTMALLEPTNSTFLRRFERLVHDHCVNSSILDCNVTFKCDRSICVLGILLVSQIKLDDEVPSTTEYTELIYAHLLDADGSRLTYTHYTGRVRYNHSIELSFNRPIYIQRNKPYIIGVVLNKIGAYARGECIQEKCCHGVTFTFTHPSDNNRHGIIRSILFSNPNTNNVHDNFNIVD